MVHAPQHLLLDEPTNGLDVPTVRGLRALLRRLRDAGACILYSSHVLAEIDAISDRVVVMAQGTAVAEGTLEDIRSRTGAASLEDAFVTLTQTEVSRVEQSHSWSRARRSSTTRATAAPWHPRRCLR